MEKKQAVVTSDTLTKEQIRELAAKSLAGIKNSYAPYSHFHVSAVLLSENGNIYTGNNIENAAYTPSVCAEPAALSLKQSAKKNVTLQLLPFAGGLKGSSKGLLCPCRVCRQVMREFCKPVLRSFW